VLHRGIESSDKVKSALARLAALEVQGG